MGAQAAFAKRLSNRASQPSHSAYAPSRSATPEPRSSQSALSPAQSLTSIPAFSPAKDAASNQASLSGSHASRLMIGSANDSVEKKPTPWLRR